MYSLSFGVGNLQSLLHGVTRETHISVHAIGMSELCGVSVQANVAIKYSYICEDHNHEVILSSSRTKSDKEYMST